MGCIDMAAKSYKVYLSFENSACVDYVTEKLKNPLSNNMIPVVMVAYIMTSEHLHIRSSTYGII